MFVFYTNAQNEINDPTKFLVKIGLRKNMHPIRSTFAKPALSFFFHKNEIAL